MGSSTYTKRDLVWLLRLKASILWRRGELTAAGEFEKLTSALQERTLMEIVQSTQVEAGLDRHIGVSDRWRHSL